MEPEARLGGVLGVDGSIGYSLGGRMSAPEDVLARDVQGEVEAEVPVEVASEDAFVAFYRAGRDRVARALALTLGDAALAADAADEAMARAYQRWARVGRLDDPGGWVYRVGLNWATSVVRRRLRAPSPPADREPTDLGPVPEPTVRHALAALDRRQRAVIVCWFYLGLSERETAAALGTRPGTVKSRLHRGLRHLQTDLAHLRPEETQ